ncbi:hypothetical protein TRVA0_012S02894 [Trichomonascus vanleenenianus]|uniref:uncharacterized protein n=1 Tax=Trichomonascus vanleenenianus TaxID=2268995 RepID=UPI003ECA125D
MEDFEEFKVYADMARKTAVYALRNAYDLTSTYLPLFTPYVRTLSPYLAQVGSAISTLNLQSFIAYIIAFYLSLMLLRYTTSAIYRSVVWMFKVVWIMTVFTCLILAAAMLLQKIE